MYSVWTLPSLLKLSKKVNKRLVLNPCFLPEFLNPQRLLREDKEELRELYSPYPELMSLFSNYIDNDLPTMGKELVKYNLMLDKYRHTDFFEVFPQYRKYKEL